MTNTKQGLHTITRAGYACLLVAASLLFAGCAVNPVSGSGDFVLISESQEVAIGGEEHVNIVAKYGLYDDPKLQAYIETIGRRLARRSHRNHLEFHFTLLDSSEVNAFALPGGYIYVTRGLLAYLNSEEELAAVIGHEIGHVTARHGVRQMSAAQATSVGMTLGSILIPELGSAGVSDALNLLGNALISGYGRDHELEADRLGAEYLARSGYDSDAMINVIRVLKNQERFERQRAGEEGREPSTYHGLFATHPDNDTRLKQVVAEAKRLDNRPVTRKPRREAFLQREDGLVFGPSRRDGVIRAGTLYHPELDLAIRFPANWQIDNLSDKVLATSADNQGQLVLKVGSRKKGASLRATLLDFYKLERLERGRALEVNGQPGYTGVAWLQGRSGKLRGRVSIVTRGKQAFFLSGVAVDEKAFSRHDGEMLASVESLHPLAGEERRLAEPLRIRVKRSAGGEQYRQLAKESPIREHAEEQLRLLNDHYPRGEPRSGSLYKVVQ